jgi:hypothetical protein
VTDPHATNGNGRRARAVVLWAFAVVIVVLVMAIGVFLSLMASNHRSDLETACRARISNKAAAIRDAQGSALADGLATTAIERQQVDTKALAQGIRDLGQQLAAASELRSRANDICATNPDFTP